MFWLEILVPKDKPRPSWYRQRKQGRHTTTKKRKGKAKGGRGIVARLMRRKG